MKRIAMAVSVGVASFVLAACGSDGSGGATASGSTGGGASSGYGYGAPAPATSAAAAPAPAASAPAGGAAAAVDVAQNPLGTILVDGAGKTLYLFEADTGTTSACSGACATAWPPFIVSAPPTAGAGVTAGDIATTPRSDGKLQVTYHGHPLYYFIKDTAPGNTSGQDVNAFGAEWYVLGADGNKIDKG